MRDHDPNERQRAHPDGEGADPVGLLLDEEADLVGLLGPIPLSQAAHRRIRLRLSVEVERRRQELVEGAFYGGFALAAVVWAVIAVIPH